MEIDKNTQVKKAKLQTHIEITKKLKNDISFQEAIEELPLEYGLTLSSVFLQKDLLLLHSTERTIDGYPAAVLIDTSISPPSFMNKDDSRDDFRVDLSFFLDDWKEIESCFNWYMGNGQRIFNMPGRHFNKVLERVIESCAKNNIRNLYVSHSAHRFEHAKRDSDSKLIQSHEIKFHNARSWNYAAHCALGSDL